MVVMGAQARGRARGSSSSSSLPGRLTSDFHDTSKHTIDSTLKHENKENQDSKFSCKAITLMALSPLMRHLA